MEIFKILIEQPLVNLLVGCYQLLMQVHIPYALGFAIIALTILVRLLLYPFTAAQLKTSKKMQELTPHINKLKEKHKDNPQRLQQETMNLYKEHGVNPLAGCLPVLVQLPILFGLYGILLKMVHIKSVSDINAYLYFDFLKLHKMWETSFFGLPIDKTPSDLLSHVGYLIFLVPVMTGFFQLIQSKMMMATAAEAAKNKTKAKDGQPDFMTTFQQQSLFLFPLMIGFFAFRFPIGLSLYWNTFTIFGIIQQYRIQGLGGLTDWINKLKKK